MGIRIICHGCGKRVDVPEEYTRRKMPCPECGVICEVPLGTNKEAPDASPAARAPARVAASPATEAKARPARKAPDNARPEPVLEADLPKAGRARVNCPHCGELVRMIAGTKGAQKCPCCGTAFRPPAPAKKPAPKPEKVEEPVVLEEVAEEPEELLVAAETSEELEPIYSEEDDGKPYEFTDKGHKRCPECSLEMPVDSVVCQRCGLNLKTGKKPEKTYTEIHRHWDAGMAPSTRWALFIAAQCFELTIVVIGSIMSGEVTVFVGSWVLFTVLLAFVLGTYDSVDLQRTTKGRITLQKRWTMSFIRKPWQEIKLSDYEGIVTGRDASMDGGDWLLLIVLFVMGGLPGLIWWLYASSKVTYYVAMSQDHGYPAMYLYRGWKEELYKDISETLQEVTGLPLQG
jgi:hypothetical protein